MLQRADNYTITMQGGQKLTTPPCSDEMLTFRHYIEHSDDLIAFNEKSSTFNPWVTIHAPLVFQNLPGCVNIFMHNRLGAGELPGTRERALLAYPARLQLCTPSLPRPGAGPEFHG